MYKRNISDYRGREYRPNTVRVHLEKRGEKHSGDSGPVHRQCETSARGLRKSLAGYFRVLTDFKDPHNLPMSSTAAQLVQYVVVRGDLLRLLSWPTGAVIAQACHASTAILWMHRNDSNTLQYTSDLDNMHKVILEAPSQGELEKLSQDLSANQIDHKLWIEQPENYPTCLATKPYPKQQIQSFFKKLKLSK